MALDALAVIFLGRPLPCLRATLPVSFIFLTLYLIVLIGMLRLQLNLYIPNQTSHF